MAKRQKTFRVEAVIKLLMEVDISADSLAEALGKSETMTRGNFLDVNNDDVIDASFRVTGVRDTSANADL